MICQDFRASVHKVLDTGGEIVWPEELRAHAGICPQCRVFFETSLALHRAMFDLPRVSPSPELVTSLRQITRQDAVPVKLGWGPEIRLAAELLLPVALLYSAQALSLTSVQHMLEVLMVLLGLTMFGVTVLKPLFLGGPEYRLLPNKS